MNLPQQLYPHQISYWQKGCDDAKAGKPADPTLMGNTGYINGFNYGLGNPRSLDWPEILDHSDFTEEDLRPDPPLKNPYMEGIESIEGILQRLETFHREFPGEFTPGQKDTYVENLLSVRNELHYMYTEDPYGE